MEIEDAINIANGGDLRLDLNLNLNLFGRIDQYFYFILDNSTATFENTPFDVYEDSLSYTDILACVILCPNLLICLSDYDIVYAVAAVYYNSKQSSRKLEIKFEDHIIERELKRYKILGILP